MSGTPRARIDEILPIDRILEGLRRELEAKRWSVEVDGRKVTARDAAFRVSKRGFVADDQEPRNDHFVVTVLINPWQHAGSWHSQSVFYLYFDPQGRPRDNPYPCPQPGSD